MQTCREILPDFREILPSVRNDLMEAYRVKQWDQVHETHESRKIKRLPYVAMPNKQDGLGFRHTVHQEDAEGLLAAWYLILQVASRGSPGVRGWLVRGSKPLTACDLGVMTGLAKETFERALEFFVAPPADWLEIAEFAGLPAGAAALPGQSAGLPADAAGKAPLYSTVLYSTSTDKREKGAGARMADVSASRTQVGALLAQIKKIEAQGGDLTGEERGELRKKRALLARLQKKQAAGDFTPEQELTHH